MPYSSISYMTSGVTDSQTLANLADKVNAPGVITDAACIANIEGAIARADSLIDSYLRGIYSGDLPLTSPPEEIQTASAEIAVFLLWLSTSRPDEDNPWLGAYKRQMQFLRDVASGRAVLDLEGGDTNPVMSCGYNEDCTYDKRQFSPGTMRGRF